MSEHGSPLEAHSPGARGWVSACAFSPAGTLVVSGSLDGTLRVWDARTGDCLQTLKGHTAGVTSCAFSPAGALVVSGSLDRTLKIWDAQTGDCLQTIEDPGPVSACAVSPGGDFIVSGSWDFTAGPPTLRVWRGRRRSRGQGFLCRAVEGHLAEITACVVSADAKSITSSSEDRTLKVWDVPSSWPRGRGPRLSLESHRDVVLACAISPDQNFIVSAGYDRTLRTWDFPSGSDRLTLEGHTGSVNACAVSPDGTYIFSGSDDSTVRVWDFHTGTEAATLSTTAPVTSVAAHPYRPEVAYGDSVGGLNIVELGGVSYGPLAATLIHRSDGLKVRCPACQQVNKAERSWFGGVIDCPNRDCDTQLRPNSSILRPRATAVLPSRAPA